MVAAPGPPAAAPDGSRRLRLVVAYDGTPFSGFARQRDRRTVQGELEAALARLAKRPVRTVGAGRTDAGVHARGQVVHADVPARLDPERVRRALKGRPRPAGPLHQARWGPPRCPVSMTSRPSAAAGRGRPRPGGFAPSGFGGSAASSRSAWSPTPSAGRW